MGLNARLLNLIKRASLLIPGSSKLKFVKFVFGNFKTGAIKHKSRP